MVVDPLATRGAVFAPLGERAAGMPVPQVVAAARRSGASPGWSPTCTATTPTPRALAAALAPGRAGARAAGRRRRRARGAGAGPGRARAGGRRPGAPARRAVGVGDGRAVHADRAAGGRRRRRPAGRVARRGGRGARAAPRRHDVPRLLVAHGAPPRPVRRRARPGQRRGGRLPAPPAGQPAARSRSTRSRRRSPPRSSAPRLAIPIHAEGYEIDGVYRPVPDAAGRFAAAAAERGVPARVLELGESIDVRA